MIIHISQYFLNIMKGILRVTKLCEISVFIEGNNQTFLSISSRTPDIFLHQPHTSIVRSLEHLWDERARENFTVDLQQRFHYSLCEKMDFIARGIRSLQMVPMVETVKESADVYHRNTCEI